ncbi:MAG: hypothetical protein J6X55_15755 [Victivallales bacterium]|nr:hypothetical protein [Victivallales bacterium]
MPTQKDKPKKELWDWWLDDCHSPSFNMAADEALLLSANLRGRPLLRFYGWDCKAVSIGYVQSASAAPEGYAYVRRPTGGGVVYHDFDFTYTVVFPANHWLNTLDRMNSYDWINRSIQAGLQSLDIQAALSDDHIPHSVDRLTMVCFTNPTKYDIILAGQKVGGSAQRRVREGLLHQGSLHFGKPLPASRDTFSQALAQGFRDIMNVHLQLFMPPDWLIGQILELKYVKYATSDWNDKRI